MVATDRFPVFTSYLFGERLGVDGGSAFCCDIGPTTVRSGPPVPELEWVEDPRVALEPVGHETRQADAVPSPRFERCAEPLRGTEVSDQLNVGAQPFEHGPRLVALAAGGQQSRPCPHTAHAEAPAPTQRHYGRLRGRPLEDFESLIQLD